MLLDALLQLIKKIFCQCRVIQDLQIFLNNPTHDSIMCWEFQNLYQIVNRKTLAAPFSNQTAGVDVIIYELAL